MSNLAIIPARGGSKRIPRKNVKDFLGKPIIAYSIEAALGSNLFEEVMVSTDDDEIAGIARSYGATIPFLRSKKTANDYATTADVINEVLLEYKHHQRNFDYACCIYATAPFITEDKLKKSYDLLVKSNFDSVVPIVPFSFSVQRGLKLFDNKVNFAHPEYINTRSQDLETIFHDAGQFYFFNVEKFTKKQQIWTENSGGLILTELEVQDIDNETDWKLAELKYKLMKGIAL
ncbi:MAG: pseudaminic acid cytidylyltransferase [Dysgonomonas sp.]